MAKTLTIRLDETTHRDFKIYAARNGVDMTKIILDHIKKLLEEAQKQAD